MWGGGCEAHGGPPRASRVANHVSEVRKKGLNGRFMRRDFNHEHWLANLDRLDMTHGGSGGTHEGSGEPHEGSGVSDECHMSGKEWFMRAKDTSGISPEATGGES